MQVLTVKVTDKHKAWLIKESDRTGESFASIVRKLIQEQIDDNELP